MASNPFTKEDSPHGLTRADLKIMQERMNSFEPRIANLGSAQNRIRSLFADDLPEGATWDIRKTAQSISYGSAGPSRNLITQQMPYQPEFASPDRQQYPVHRILANRYWRLFYKLDPVIGNCIDLYSELPWSNFELTGEGVEGEVRRVYEDMCRETQLLAMLPHFVREYNVVGEAIPHTFFDDSKGMFTHISMHNPDQLQVIDAPFVKMDPILQFIPDDRLITLMTASDPQLRAIRDSMPKDLLTTLSKRENVTLSPINCTFIPRKLHPYDTRGTSLISRMWRVLMLEDAIFNASLQTARRAAAPLKVAKLGNAATGFIPPPEQEQRLTELLAQAESDPQAWLVYHYGISFEMVGNNDRAMFINREWDTIERMKLVAMGLSKAFLHGEVTYASANTGLQVFLQRLKALRTMIEQKWLYPKFFKPVAEINGFIKPKPSEVMHRYRIKRSAVELAHDENAYILPRVVWDKSLDSQANGELVQAMVALESIGVKFSKTSKMASIGHNFEDETKKISRESQFEKQFLPKTQAPQQPGGGGGGMPGGGAPPPPSEGGEEGSGEEQTDPNAPGAAAGVPAPGEDQFIPGQASKKADKSKSKDKSTKKRHKVEKQDVAGILSELSKMMSGEEVTDPLFMAFANKKSVQAAINSGDNVQLEAQVQDFLWDLGYDDDFINEVTSSAFVDRELTDEEFIEMARKATKSKKPSDEFVGF